MPKMLKEEKELREWIYGIGYPPPSGIIRNLVRAVREECAKVVEGCGKDELYEAVADAVRKGKSVQQCTYCGFMKDDITSNGECRTCRAMHRRENG